MSTANTQAALSVMMGLLNQAVAVGSVLAKAKAEGRDVTPEELDGVLADYATARAALQAQIDAAKAAAGAP